MLILGGTFDPPHVGHLVLALSAAAELGEGAVTFMPAGDPWRKRQPAIGGQPSEGGQLPAAGHQPADLPSPARTRVALLRLALRDAEARLGSRTSGPGPRLLLDARETQRPGPTYTAETLAELQDEGAGDLVLLLGSDALADLPNWHEPSRILELARLAVTPRPTEGADPLEKIIAGLDRLIPGAGGRILRLRQVPPLDISSRDIRQRVRLGLPITYLVPPGVERRIRGAGLYR
jgi:nicotinate-nucleotide adenylyltransferase